jgi:ABC-2 type transport system ATP-binding protein
MYAIECDALTKIYRRAKRKVPAVDHLNLQIEPGQVYGFLGPNGAGKTTTIRMLLDLVHPSVGSVKLFGQPIRNNIDSLRNVGALVEGASFYPYLSAWDNLRILGWSVGQFDEERARMLLESLGLTGREQEPVRKYSTGMQQRLGIVAALLNDPELVILDEPTNGLDPAGIHELRAFIRNLVDNHGKTVFLSSHLLGEVQQICDRVAIIHHGRLLVEGRVSDLLAQQAKITQNVLLEVSPLDRAKAALAGQWQVAESENRGILSVRASREQLPNLARQLLAAEVDLYGMYFPPASLEDLFLTITAET